MRRKCPASDWKIAPTFAQSNSNKWQASQIASKPARRSSNWLRAVEALRSLLASSSYLRQAARFAIVVLAGRLGRLLLAVVFHEHVSAPSLLLARGVSISPVPQS